MRAHAFVTTTALACVLLAGCTDDPVGPVEDTSAPTTSASPTPTPTGPTPPPLPDAAQADTAQGALSFAEHYVALMNFSAATGEIEAMRAVSDAGCKACGQYMTTYTDTYENGGYFEDPRWAPTAQVAQSEGGAYTVLMDVTAPDAKFKESANSAVQTGAGGKFNLRFRVRFEDGSWFVNSFGPQTLTPDDIE